MDIPWWKIFFGTEIWTRELLNQSLNNFLAVLYSQFNDWAKFWHALMMKSKQWIRAATATFRISIGHKMVEHNYLRSGWKAQAQS